MQATDRHRRSVATSRQQIGRAPHSHSSTSDAQAAVWEEQPPPSFFQESQRRFSRTRRQSSPPCLAFQAGYRYLEPGKCHRLRQHSLSSISCRFLSMARSVSSVNRVTDVAQTARKARTSDSSSQLNLSPTPATSPPERTRREDANADMHRYSSIYIVCSYLSRLLLIGPVVQRHKRVVAGGAVAHRFCPGRPKDRPGQN